MKDTIKIGLWSGPRNISTALMYSFAQRQDTFVFDEPLYAYYLCNSEANLYHPGVKEIISSQENNPYKVIQEMVNFNDYPVVFYKNMAHHLVNLDLSFTSEFYNIILTRNPLEMIASLTKVISSPTINDTAFLYHEKLISFFERRNTNYLILDSSDLLKNPELILKKICNSIQIPFENKMLSWKKGGNAQDGIWAKYWYDNVHNSEGFVPYQVKNISISDKYEGLLNQCNSIYDKLIKSPNNIVNH